MRDPRPVEPVVRLAGLVGANLLERDGRGLGVGAVRHERRHAAHRDRTPAVAGLHEQLGVGAHERRRHRHRRPVGHDELGPGVAEHLDDAEQVVPAARVEARHVLAQLVQDLVHLERRGDRLDQHGRPHGAPRDAERLLREHEHVVPEARLEVALEFRQVVEGAVAVVDELLRRVEEVQPEVDERARGAFAVDEHVLLGQVPAARAGDDGGAAHVGAQRVGLALGRGVGEGAARRVAQVAHAADDVRPGGARRVLHVGEPDPRARVQRVDGHLGGHRRARDLDPAVDERVGRGRHAPVAGPHVGRLGQEAERLARGDALAAFVPRGEQVATARVEPLVQLLDEGEGLVGEDLAAARDLVVAGDLDAHAAAAPFRGCRSTLWFIFAQKPPRRYRNMGNGAA